MNWKYFVFIPLIFILIAYIGKFITTAPLLLVWGTSAFILGIITFQKPEFGILVIVFAMMLSPEIVIAQLYKRSVVIRIEDLIIIIVFIAWLAHCAAFKEWKGFVKTPLDTPLIVISCIYILSTAKGIITGDLNPIKSLFYVLKYIEYYILYWTTTNILSSTKDIPKYLIAGLITCIIVTIFVYSLFGKTERVYGPFDSEASGITGESASLGGYYIIVMALILSFFIFLNNRKLAWLLIILFISLLPPFVRTLSRASFYSFPPMLLTIILFAPKKRFTLLLISITGILLFPIVANDLYISMIKRLQETFGGPAKYYLGPFNLSLELSAASRVESWKVAFTQWIPKHPFIGHGLTGVGLSDAQYPLLLGEIGLIGFSIFVYIIGKIYIISWKVLKYTNSPISQGLALGLMAALSGLLVQGIGVNTFIIIRIMEPFWFLTALVVGVIYSQEMEQTLNISTNEKPINTYQYV